MPKSLPVKFDSWEIFNMNYNRLIVSYVVFLQFAVYICQGETFVSILLLQLHSILFISFKKVTFFQMGHPHTNIQFLLFSKF